MKNALLILTILFGITASAQTDTIAKTKTEILPEITPENAFKNDAAKNMIKVYIIGGIVSAIGKKELEFAKKYTITFHDFGCLVPVDIMFYKEYNQLAFEHLTQGFGKSWLEEINPNVIGISKYKERI